MWKPPESRTLFDLHFDRFDGFIFKAKKPFQNVCATGASPVQLQVFLHLLDCKPQNMVAVLNLQQLKKLCRGWSGSRSKNNLDAERPFLQQHAAAELQSVAVNLP